jgi:hypothetical protein
VANGGHSRSISNAFCIALLLTGDSDAACTSVVDGINALDAAVFSPFELIRETVRAASEFNDGFNDRAKALAMLPFELRRLFALSPICRRCFVLRFLAGLGPGECSALLKLSDREFELSLGESLRSLAQVALAEMQPAGFSR